MKRAEIFFGVLLILALLLQPCLAVLTPNYLAKNQAGKPLDSPGFNKYGKTLAYGDYLLLNDKTWTPGSEGETIDSWTWTLTNLSNLADYVEKTDPNASFGPFTNNRNSYLLNLTVRADDGRQYSPPDMVYQVYDYRDFVSVDYEAVPAYDDRTPTNPNGTITFRDLSYSYLDPMIYTTEWWWKWTDLTTGVSKTLSGQDHFKEDMTDTDFMVNLTVNNSQGNLVSITGITPIPPDHVYPIANFSVIPMSGVAPLEIGITDQALSMVNYTVSDVPLSYNYTVWNDTGVNVFGKEFTTKNFNVTLSDPGIYNITQNVTNSFGVSDESTVGDIVVALPDGPIVNFSASVREGLAPLNVTLIDKSTGVKPFICNWTIGNATWNSTKNDDNPQFNLTYSGSYWVKLNVTDNNGLQNEITRLGFITVGPQKYPIVDFTAIPNRGPYPLKVSFIDQSVINPDILSTNPIENVNYTWDFGDGLPDSYEKNPTHIYNETKNYTVNLYVSSGGNGVQRKTGFVNVTDSSDYPDLTLNASFIAVPQFGNPPLTVSFVDTSRKNEPVTYYWDFDDGETSTEPNVTHVFGTPRLVPIQNQRYNVKLQITGLMSGRISEYSQWIEVQELDANFTNQSDTKDPLKIVFNSTCAGYPTQWYCLFGDGYTSRDQNPEHEYVSSGTYNVTLHAWNELRKDSKQNILTI